MAQNAVDPLTFILYFPFYFVAFVASVLPPPQLQTQGSWGFQFSSLPTQTKTAPAQKAASGKASGREEWTIEELPNGGVRMIIQRMP